MRSDRDFFLMKQIKDDRQLALKLIRQSAKSRQEALKPLAQAIEQGRCWDDLATIADTCAEDVIAALIKGKHYWFIEWAKRTGVPGIFDKIAGHMGVGSSSAYDWCAAFSQELPYFAHMLNEVEIFELSSRISPDDTRTWDRLRLHITSEKMRALWCILREDRVARKYFHKRITGPWAVLWNACIMNSELRATEGVALPANADLETRCKFKSMSIIAKSFPDILRCFSQDDVAAIWLPSVSDCVLCVSVDSEQTQPLALEKFFNLKRVEAISEHNHLWSFDLQCWKFAYPIVESESGNLVRGVFDEPVLKQTHEDCIEVEMSTTLQTYKWENKKFVPRIGDVVLMRDYGNNGLAYVLSFWTKGDVIGVEVLPFVTSAPPVTVLLSGASVSAT